MSNPPDTFEKLSGKRRELFEMLVKESKKHKTAPQAQVIPRRPSDGPAALSFAQRRVWLLDQIEPGSSAYNLAGAYRFEGEINQSALEHSLDEIFRRHESLRTVFTEIDGRPAQIISQHQKLPLATIDLGELPETDRLRRAYKLAYEEAQRPFKLSQGPLVRATLLKLNAQDHVFAVIMHHIISDGWSIGILVREMSALYEAFCADAQSPLSELPIQYVDFAVWQQQWLQDDKLQSQLSYWKQQLDGAATVIELPTDHPRPAVQSRNGSTQLLALSKALSESLKALSRAQGATLFMVLLTAFKVLLHRYTGQDDIIVGTPIANRNKVETHGLIGFFVNTLALRTDLSGNPTFLQALARVREVALGAYANQDAPFEKLVEVLRPERDVSRPPLLQVMFALHNNDIPSLELRGLKITPLSLHSGAINFDLVMGVEESSEGMRVLLEYSTALFDASAVVRMLEHFQQLLEAVKADPNQRIESLKMLGEAERHKILVEWNNTRADYPEHVCAHELIEAQAGQTPDATAVVFGDERLSYSELNHRANQLASRLRRAGVTPDSRVGLCVERSLEMVIGLLGILKAGGAYVPLDPTHPKDRLAFILEDARVSTLLTQKKLLNHLSHSCAQVICLDADWSTIIREEGNALPLITSPNNLAYVIYTSGSTGKPKGVQIPHRALVNFLFSMRREPGLEARDRLLSVTTISFDIAGLEIFLPLISGASVILASLEETVDAVKLRERMTISEATIMQATPATWRMLLDSGWAGSKRLKIFCGGEALEQDLARQLSERSPEAWNLYGPTETTIWSSIRKINPTDAAVLIGRPIANTKIHLLGKNLEPIPVGVFGELHIGGDGLARGYLDRASLTAERFIPDPFTDEPGARLYKTGDLARYMPDGGIEFSGRIDHQVKLRGFRIELGEIEAVMSEHPAIRKAVVIDREDKPGDKKLVAYLTLTQKSATAESGPVADALRNLLREKLPEYMVPSAFVVLDELPLTANGKLDRSALPAPEVRAQRVFEAPRTETQQAIARVWRQALDLSEVGLHDNFFDIGGHSLLLVKIHRHLQQLSSKPISALDLFRYTTISSLAEFINQRDDEIRPAGGRVETYQQIAQQRDADIAIIGMAGRFPGAANTDMFWENLRDGVESIKPFPEETLKAAGIDLSVLKDPNYVNAAAVLDDVDMFDASFFGFNPKEAEVMDPQHRIFLECAWEALENAGYNSETYAGRIGVYAGANLSGYLLNLLSNRGVVDGVWNFQTLLGNDKDFLPTRVSYKLNLKGPSLSVQTACSTSLVAVHLACRSLLNAECDMAMAGGVSISHLQKSGYFHQEGSLLSPDGHCRAFDARAKGTVFGSGVGIVILKRLADAVTAGDNILAVIKATAINNDGASKVGYTAPSISGQVDVISRAQALAGIDPETVSYIEAHGTGTEMGDPIEIAALTEAFRAATDKKRFCAIGSAKTNVGHLDAAAGVTGLIKTVLALRHKMIPPSLHFNDPNPNIDFDNSPFYVNTELREWESKGQPRRAAVSSFGIGGTNSHVVLEEAPARQETAAGRSIRLLAVSARTNAALNTATANLIEHLKQTSNTSLADVEHTLLVGRKAFAHRRVVICRDVDDALDALERKDSKRVLTGTGDARRGPLVFMFPGQGSQYVNMGRDLYEQEPAFREAADLCSQFLEPRLGFDLRETLYPQADRAREATELLNQTYVTQPAIFVIEYALSQLWSAWGIRPDVMIGHSLGEYVAACLAGVFSLEDALSLVAARGKLIQSLPAGAMLAVPLSEEAIQPLLNERLWLASVSGPALCAVSGTPEAVADLERRLTGDKISCRRLSTSHAFHSAMMEPILDLFADELKRIKLNAPTTAYLSNVTGEFVKESEATAPDYWVRQLRETVRLGDCLSEILKQPRAILLEVGPGRGLSGLANRQSVGQAGHLILSCLNNSGGKDSDSKSLLKAMGQLWLAGVEADWAGFYAHEHRYRVALPTYPFERQRYWIEAQKERPSGELGTTAELGTTRKKKLDVGDWFYAPVWKQSVKAEDTGPRPDIKTWLVFTDERGFGLRLAEQLEARARSVVTVAAGPNYGKLREGVFIINPESRDDYIALIEDLRNAGQLPQSIIHPLGLTSLVLLVQALSEHKLAITAGGAAKAEPIEIIVTTTETQPVSGQERLIPEKAAVSGACRVIPQEYANLTCRVIDMPVTEPDTWQEQKLIGQIIKEASLSSHNTVVAYRGINRWAQEIEAVRLNGESYDARLKGGGVYLIIGAFDGPGYEIGYCLARLARPKLILVEPSPLSDNLDRMRCRAGSDNTEVRAKNLEAIREAGAETLVFSADITDLSVMRDVLNKAQEKFGEVNGVFHAAAVTGGGIIELQKPEEMNRALSTVIKSTQVLDTLFQESNIDLMVLCSPAHSITGGIGQMNSCAAAAFLETVAYRNAMLNGPFTMALSLDASFLNGDSTGFEMTSANISSEDRLKAFSRVMACDLPHAIVSARHLPALVNCNGAAIPAADFAATGGDASHSRPQTSAEYVSPANKVERVITTIWEKLLGIEQVGVYDNFFELGGHSLIAIDVLSEIREAFGVQVQMARLFDDPTVSSLAATVGTLIEQDAGATASVIAPVSRQAYRMKATSGRQTEPDETTQKSE